MAAYGFMMNSSTVARHYRQSNILEIGEGTTEVQLLLIAREVACAFFPPCFLLITANSLQDRQSSGVVFEESKPCGALSAQAPPGADHHRGRQRVVH